MNKPEYERVIAAEAERVALIQQAVRQHADNIAVEMRRFQAELGYINEHANLRTKG